MTDDMTDDDSGLYPGVNGADGDYEPSELSELPAISETYRTYDTSEPSEPSEGYDSSERSDSSELSKLSGLRAWMRWLAPHESDEDGDGRTGILSTHTEVHAFALGYTAGAHFGLTGDAQLINDVAGFALLGDRVRRANAFPARYLEQAQEELPHFLGGVAVGIVATRTGAISMLPEVGSVFGVGV